MNRWLTGLLIVLSLALIAAVAVWVTRDDSESGGEGATATAGEATIVSAGELAEFAAERPQPVYWLGARGESEYELTATGGRVYVRYLEGDAEAGDPRDDFVTVGTYPSKHAVADLRRAAKVNPGAKLGKTSDGATLLIEAGSPDNAHLAYPGDDFQVEIFSPKPGEAQRLAKRGAAQPVG